MMAEEVCIGAGGWGYFSGGLASYAKAFRFVEVNSTFYRLPAIKDVSRWRRTVPPTFTFSVKAPRRITHTGGSIDNATAREHLAATAKVCAVLKAPWLVLEYPPRRVFERKDCAGLVELISSAGMGATVCLEARAYKRRELPPKLAEMMRENAIIDVVDPIIQEPRVESCQAYFRVFGKGEQNVYQPTDEELEDADDRVSRGGMDMMVFAFHGVKMYKDAARFTTFKRTGKFPKVTGGEGVSSLEEILKRDGIFPSSKDELVQRLGWMLVDLADTKRMRASVFLRQLDTRVYSSPSDVVNSLRPFSSRPGIGKLTRELSGQ